MPFEIEHEECEKRMERKVLMLNYYFPPHNVVAVFRALRFASCLGDFGWSPVVLTCHPHVHEVPTDEGLLKRIPEHVPVERVKWQDPRETLVGETRILRSLVPWLNRGNRSGSSESSAPDRGGERVF